MALFTKLFERDHNPYDVKGRWYRFKLENNAVKEKDPIPRALTGEPFITGGNIIFAFTPSNLHIVDYHVVIDTKTAPANSTTWVKEITFYSTGRIGLRIPAAIPCYVYVLIEEV